MESSAIFNLLTKWLDVDINENKDLLEKISTFLQGRPRFLTSFLHKLIFSSDIKRSFELYVKEMTTDNNDVDLQSISPYSFWKQRIDMTIVPIHKKNIEALEKKNVSDVLIKLCISYLFGSGSSIAYEPNFDLVSTNLVMVKQKWNEWFPSMAEPIVLMAGLNFLANVDSDVFAKYFASKLFAPLAPQYATPQERGHIMEAVIALRFRQGWWLEPDLQQFLPEWARNMNIPKPRGIIDCRQKEKKSNLNLFVHQLRNPSYEWAILPPVNAGPDLRYSIFCCYVKTTSTSNSKSSMYVSAEECKKNIEMMNPRNWYGSQLPVQSECLKELENGQKFVHLRFELPDTAPSMKDTFISGTKDDDFVICVNLESEFAKLFFGDYFVREYKQLVTTTISKA